MKSARLLLAAGLSLFITSSFAGLVQPAPVIVEINPDGSGYASGDLQTARNSKNRIEMIGCGSRYIETGTGVFKFAFCQAVMDDGSTDGVRAFCTAPDNELIDAIQELNDTSFVTFAFDDNGTCTRIGASTQSFYLPKTKQNRSNAKN